MGCTQSVDAFADSALYLQTSGQQGLVTRDWKPLHDDIAVGKDIEVLAERTQGISEASAEPLRSAFARLLQTLADKDLFTASEVRDIVYPPGRVPTALQIIRYAR